MKIFKKHIVIFVLFFAIDGNTQELHSYIDIALNNNPEIKKFELQYQRASEKTNEVNTVPNTELGLGYFVSEPETRTGAQRFKISAKQMLPWFGTITSRKNYISSLADAKYEDIAIAKRKLIASVSKSYYNLYINKAKLKVIRKNIELLKTYKTMALTSVEVGKASAVDVLRLQIRENETEQLFDVLNQQNLAEQTNFNKLLNRKENLEVAIKDKLKIPTEKLIVVTENLALHPELLKYDKLYQSIEQSELLNKKESSPMIGFGLDYINVDKRSNMSFDDNGKDIIMPMISVSIPIFNKKYKSKTKQNQLAQQEIKTQKESRLNKLLVVLDKAVKMSNSAKISYNTHTENLKQAKNAEIILMKTYETGVVDFKDILDVQELQLKFQINQLESIKAYFIQKTIINYLAQKK